MNARRTTFVLGGAAAAVAAMVACADLFDSPSQCQSDRDCTKFGAVCDLTRAVCVPPGSVTGDEGGSTDGGGSQDATDESPPLPADCNISPKPVVEIVGNPIDGAGETEISDLLVDCTKDWSLKTKVFVKAGSTITIQQGVTIRADPNAGLIIRPGGKIVAQGTRDNPIIFTSSSATPAPGDWSGLFWFGTASPAATFTAQDATYPYGGPNSANDDNGTMQFVRVEYSKNPLVFAGIGAGSKIDSVEVRKTTDDCFDINGGHFNAKHLICQYPADEMWQIGAGYQGKLQFLFGQRTPATGGGHNGLLVENNAFPTVYNATVCGTDGANQGQGFVFRNNGRFDVNDMIVTGWNSGMDAIGTLGTPLSLRNTTMFGNAQNPAFIEDDAGMGDTANDDNLFDEAAFFADGGTNVTDDPGLDDCHNPTAPAPWPAAAINGIAPPDDGFFDKNASFVGAFKDSNDAWAKGAWAKFSDK